MAVAVFATFSIGEFFDFFPFSLYDRLNDKLPDTVAIIDFNRLIAIVENDYADVATIVTVDGAKMGYDTEFDCVT